MVAANGAEVLGIYDEVGSVEVGKIADLVVLEGNLLADPTVIRDVRYVFRSGLGYDADKLVESINGHVGIR